MYSSYFYIENCKMNDIIKRTRKGRKMEEYINIGKIDIEKYSDLCENEIITDEVIITFKQIEHIDEERYGIFEKYKDSLEEIVLNPDYIIKDTKHKDTGLVIKRYEKDVVVVLKLNTADKEKKNSIITIWEIKDKRLQRYLVTHKIVYKSE